MVENKKQTKTADEVINFIFDHPALVGLSIAGLSAYCMYSAAVFTISNGIFKGQLKTIKYLEAAKFNSQKLLLP